MRQVLSQHWEWPQGLAVVVVLFTQAAHFIKGQIVDIRVIAPDEGHYMCVDS